MSKAPLKDDKRAPLVNTSTQLCAAINMLAKSFEEIFHVDGMLPFASNLTNGPLLTVSVGKKDTGEGIVLT